MIPWTPPSGLSEDVGDLASMLDEKVAMDRARVGLKRAAAETEAEVVAAMRRRDDYDLAIPEAGPAVPPS